MAKMFNFWNKLLRPEIDPNVLLLREFYFLFGGLAWALFLMKIGPGFVECGISHTPAF